jgi:AcrR family transcriptional regulator
MVDDAMAVAGGIVEARTTERELTGEKARRIVDAMRESVAEVGIAGSTFERVSRKAGVSRGLLHYYFGTKERLLVEVIKRDTEIRIEDLEAALREARTADQVILSFFTMFERTMSEEQGYVYLVSELFIAGRHNDDIRNELGNLYSSARKHFADILRQKEREGVLRLRFDAESVVSYLFSAGDGAAFQQLSEPQRDFSAAAAAGFDVARFLLSADA